MGNLKIVQLNPDDYEEIIGVWTRAGLSIRPKGRDSREELTRQIRANPEWFIGVRDSSEDSAGDGYRRRRRFRSFHASRENSTEISYGCVTGEDGKLVGVIIASHDTRRGYLNRIAVDPSYQGKGIAKMLTEKAEEMLRANGIKVITLQIEGKNEASRALALSMGFVEHEDIVYYSKRTSPED